VSKIRELMGKIMENLFKKGEEVDYYGRSGKIKNGSDKRGYVVIFDDTGEEEYVEAEKLAEQNGLSLED
jgi:hypothetical protein